MRLLTAGCVRLRLSAACENEPCWATLAKAWRWARFMRESWWLCITNSNRKYEKDEFV